MAGKRIALVTNFMVIEYFSYIYLGACEEIRKQGHKLVCIPVGDFDLPDKDGNKRPEIFKVIDRDLFDGMIINEGPFFNIESTEKYPEVIERFHSLPAVGLATKFSRLPHICLDNEKGIDLLFTHLIEHGCRKIAYISGPELNKDSQERTIAYLKNIKEHGFVIPEQYVQHTSFYPGYVEEIIDRLLADKAHIPDAIMCGNDVIADNTFICLRERGIHVPDSIKVTGFDNSSYALENEITTISIQRKEQGSEAAKILNRLLSGQQIKLYTKIPVKLVCRKSCGCNEENPFGEFVTSYYKQIAAQKQLALNIHRTGQNLNSAKTMSELKTLLDESFTWIGVENCALYLLSSFSGKGKLYYTNGIFTAINSLKGIESYKNFIQGIFDNIPEGEVCILLPLYTKNIYLGILAVYKPKHDLVLYENLGLQISEAIHTVRTMEKSQKHLAKIEKSLREKELLLREIHHRVKNNLQIILSLINLKTRNSGKRNLDDVAANLRASISSIALVHESIYQETNLERISLREYLKSLFSTIYQINTDIDKIDIIIQGREVQMNLEKAINLGLVFSELFLNTMKYAYPGNSRVEEKKISIELFPGKDCCRIVYSDNGCGYEPAGNSNHGFGLTIVSSLINDQLAGSFSDQSVPGEGASYGINFPTNSER
ncbi:MAG: substrate-binding domain-containing protein [Spirochaetales bacterium]|nr:substrate-binding domain-containing protein [Spirochaetales bacterium]